MTRVLRPGGTLILVDHIESSSRIARGGAAVPGDLHRAAGRGTLPAPAVHTGRYSGIRARASPAVQTWTSRTPRRPQASHRHELVMAAPHRAPYDPVGLSASARSAAAFDVRGCAGRRRGQRRADCSTFSAPPFSGDPTLSFDDTPNSCQSSPAILVNLRYTSTSDAVIAATAGDESPVRQQRPRLRPEHVTNAVVRRVVHAKCLDPN